MSTRTRTSPIVTPYAIYKTILKQGFKIANYDYLTSDRGIYLKLSSGYFEDDVIFMEYLNVSGYSDRAGTEDEL